MQITLPHNWEARGYQKPLWDYLAAGGKRAVVSWHRRSGKDAVKLQADTYLKVAAKADRGSWGDAKEDRRDGVTVVVQRGGVVSLVDGGSQGTHIQEIPAENVMDGEYADNAAA